MILGVNETPKKMYAARGIDTRIGRCGSPEPVGWTDRKRPMNESGEREREERQPEEIRFLAGWTFRGWVQCNAASQGHGLY